jgi:hypothetical protein
MFDLFFMNLNRRSGDITFFYFHRVGVVVSWHFEDKIFLLMSVMSYFFFLLILYSRFIFVVDLVVEKTMKTLD